MSQFSILCDILQLQVPQTVISYSEKLTHPNTHAESREKVKTLSHNILFMNSTTVRNLSRKVLCFVYFSARVPLAKLVQTCQQ